MVSGFDTRGCCVDVDISGYRDFGYSFCYSHLLRIQKRDSRMIMPLLIFLGAVLALVLGAVGIVVLELERREKSLMKIESRPKLVTHTTICKWDSSFVESLK